MTPAELLDHLAQLKVTIVAGPALDDPGHHLDDATLAAARRHPWLFAWALEGAATGHAWHACDACREVQLIKKAGRCRMTPGCGGQMRPAGPPINQRNSRHTTDPTPTAHPELGAGA